MSLKRKLWLGLALMLLMIVPFAGGVSAQDSTELVLWHAWQGAEGDGLLALIDAFQAANPDITITQVYNPNDTIQDSFIAAAGSGEGPDMIIWANDSTGPWASAGLVLDLTEYITPELMDNVSQTAWDTFTFNGSIYGVPESAKTLAFFYNRSLVPDAPETWDEVLEISEELAADGITGLAFQSQFFDSAGFLFGLGGSLMDEDGNATFGEGGAGVEGMDAYLEFHRMMYELGQDPESGVVIDQTKPNPQFQTGEVAMVFDGVWNLAQYQQDLGSDLGVALMPALDNGVVPSMFAQTVGFFANANLEGDQAKIDAFITWAEFVTGPEGQQILVEQAGHMPVNPEISIEGNVDLETFAQQAAVGTAFPNRAELAAFWSPMQDAIDAVGAGGEDVDAARETAYGLIQAQIDQIHEDAMAAE